MTKTRSGPQTDDIFSKLKKKDDPKSEKRTTYQRNNETSGLPEARSRTTIYLYDRQIFKLDRLSMSIRETSGSIVSRAEIIRAIIDAVIESNKDLSFVQGENELKEELLRSLEGYETRQ